MKKVNMFYGAAITILSYTFGQYWYLFAGFMLLNVIDYVSGWTKSKFYTSTISSSVGAKGIIKKVSYWVVIGIAFYISFGFSQMGELIGVDLSFTELFGWFTLATYMINELRSIIENLVEMDIKVPDILVKGLAVAEKITNDKAGEVIEKESEEEK